MSNERICSDLLIGLHVFALYRGVIYGTKRKFPSPTVAPKCHRKKFLTSAH